MYIPYYTYVYKGISLYYIGLKRSGEKKQMKRKFKNVERQFDVVQNNIVGIDTRDGVDGKEVNKLYMVVWQRLANSDIIYVWAKDENEAYDRVGFNPTFVKHTIVEINPESMPIEVGVQG